REPLTSPLPHPKTEGDHGDSRSDEPRRDGDELGLDSRDPVRDSDILRRILGSPAVREDEEIRTRTREIDREGTGGAVYRKQPVAPADERIQLVLFLAEDVQVHDIARERRELPGHPAAADHFDLIHVEPRRSWRNRRNRPLRPLQERSREERLSGEKQHATDEKEDPRRLPEVRHSSEAAYPLHRPAPVEVIGVRLFVRSQCASNSHREVTGSDSQIGECYLHRAPSKKLYGASRHGLQPRPIT